MPIAHSVFKQTVLNVSCRCHVINEWAEFVTSRSRDSAAASLYDVYRYAFGRLLSVGLVDRITLVDTAATCHPAVAKDATPCDNSCLHQMPVSA